MGNPSHIPIIFLNLIILIFQLSTHACNDYDVIIFSSPLAFIKYICGYSAVCALKIGQIQ
jgi:hypothetical protein